MSLFSPQAKGKELVHYGYFHSVFSFSKSPPVKVLETRGLGFRAKIDC